MDKQVAEKKQLREVEQARESELDENLIRGSKLALLLEKQQEEVNCQLRGRRETRETKGTQPTG